MKFKKLNLKKLMDYGEHSDKTLKLHLVSKSHTLSRQIDPSEINRPGLSLMGFYDSFAYNRMQIIGKGEFAYLKKIEKDNNTAPLEKMFSYNVPGFIFSHKNHPPDFFIRLAATNQIPVAVSELETSPLIRLMKAFYETILAPRMTMHGVMVEIFGMGVMLTGAYGVGKSECALELIERGHIFVADDVIDIRLLEQNTILASSSKIISHHMEIQGIGIINIAHLFGVGSIRNEKDLDLIIKIETYKANKSYERIGINIHYQEVLGIKVPCVILPIQPGTNLPILIETATMNQRLKSSGYNTAKEFSQKLMNFIEQGKDIF